MPEGIVFSKLAMDVILINFNRHVMQAPLDKRLTNQTGDLGLLEADLGNFTQYFT
jgi:hypothetical protein